MGVITLSDALRMANEQGVDLVEVASGAVPPVCRLLDYGKFRYEQAKKERESRKSQKSVELREVRMRPRIDQHDIAYKSKRIREFLDEGHKVKLSVLFRGREITHPELAIGLLRRVAESLAQSAKLEKPPALEGRMMTMILAPLPSGKRPGGDGKAPAAATTASTPAKTQEKTNAKT